MERATCWSITINNPQSTDYQIPLPVGWKLEGQLEKGEQGTEHYQGMLRTQQVRFSAVKKVFPRAHIEVARNPAALKKYVHKEETRTAIVESIPTLFEYQGIIAGKWDDEGYFKWAQNFPNKSPDEVAMLYLDSLVAEDIESGRRGAEFIAINPMWRSSWKTFWRSIIKRYALQPLPQPPAQAGEEVGSPAPPCSSTACRDGACESEADISTS